MQISRSLLPQLRDEYQSAKKNFLICSITHFHVIVHTHTHIIYLVFLLFFLFLFFFSFFLYFCIFSSFFHNKHTHTHTHTHTHIHTRIQTWLLRLCWGQMQWRLLCSRGRAGRFCPSSSSSSSRWRCEFGWCRSSSSRS